MNVWKKEQFPGQVIKSGFGSSRRSMSETIILGHLVQVNVVEGRH